MNRLLYTFQPETGQATVKLGRVAFDPSTSARLISFQSALAGWVKHPFLGYGVHTPWANANRNAVVSFLRAVHQGIDWLYDPKNKPEAVDILIKHTGHPLEKVNQDTDRDNFMSAEEALSYRLIDKVIERMERPIAQNEG